MNIKHKLKLSVSLIFLAILLLTWLGINYVASFQREQLLQSRFEQLVSLREALASHIKDYEKSTILAVETIAHDRTVGTALLELSKAYNELSSIDLPSSGLVLGTSQLTNYYQQKFIGRINTKIPNTQPLRSAQEYLPKSKPGLLLQSQFLTQSGVLDNQTYVALHQQYDNYLQPLIRLHGFYDLFLIDPKGNVIYSATKEVDLGTNLLSGPYQSSGLAKAFRASQNSVQKSFSHASYQAYEPSYNLPASFIGMPIYRDSQYIGSIAVQLPIEPINKIMTFNGNVANAGLNSTGEAYLIGEDFTMRNDSRFIADMTEPLIAELGTTIGIQEVKTQAVTEAKKGNKGFEVINDYRNQPVLSAYGPIDLFGEKAAIIAEIDEKTVLGEINQTINEIIYKLLLVALVIWALLLIFFNQLMIRPLRKINLKLEHELLEQEKQVMVSLSLLNEYKKAVDASAIVSKTDTDGNIIYVNDAFSEVSGYSKHELIGQNHNVIRNPEMPKKVFQDLWQTITKNEIWKGVLCNLTKSGKEYYVSNTIVPILSVYGDTDEYISIATDITELYLRRQEMLQHTVDELTQLPNRQKFLINLSQVETPRLAIINIDHFSEVNDFYGYEVGDKLLIKIAELLVNMEDGEVSAYRLSGDEFGLLGDKNCSSEAFEKRCMKILENLSHTVFSIDSNELTVSATMGVAEKSGNVYVKAGMALRVAKESQKKFLFYNSDIDIQRRTGENLRWTKAIKDAIEDERMALYIQPIVNRVTGAVDKYECLMRLIDEDGSVVSPFYFIDISKHARLYPKISEIIIRKSFEYFSNRVESFSINLTIIDILNEHTVELLKELIFKHNAAKRVILEIVESEGIENFDDVSSFIQEMKSLGCRIAIDDFGTGYSNFEYLIKLNPDFIKIDGSLVKNIAHDEGVFAIVKLINDFAKSIGTKTVAEYVCDKEVDTVLKGIGIDYLQGYYHGTPTSVDAPAAALRKVN